MPVVVTADFPSITPELYVETHRAVMSGGRPEGMIAHCCAEKNGGITVTDIWESRESFDAFIQGNITKVIEKTGSGGGPENMTITNLINADAFEYRGTVLP